MPTSETGKYLQDRKTNIGEQRASAWKGQSRVFIGVVMAEMRGSCRGSAPTRLHSDNHTDTKREREKEGRRGREAGRQEHRGHSEG